MEKNINEQPKIYKEREEEKTREKIIKFIDSLEKLDDEIYAKKIKTEDFEKIFTLERVVQIRRYMEIIGNEIPDPIDGVNIGYMFEPLRVATRKVEISLENNAYRSKTYKEFDMNNIRTAIIGLIGAKKFFLKEK